jgi:hypothetical protein
MLIVTISNYGIMFYNELIISRHFPFIKRKKKTYVEYIKQDITTHTTILDDAKQYKCTCCLSTHDSYDMITCNKCTKDKPHAFCKECVEGYINYGINSCDINQSCMFVTGTAKCGGIFTVGSILKCTSKEIFDKFEEMVEIREVNKFYKKLNNYQVCPSCRKCGTTANKNILKCNNKKCKQKWCSKCMKNEHAGYKCNQILNSADSSAIRLIVEETVNSAFTHKCPSCKSIYIKEEGRGCNHMTCSVCNTRSCYLCGMTRCKCSLYNDDHDDFNIDNVNDKGNWLYNRKRIIKTCKKLLIVNNKDVQLLMIEELEKHKIYINIDDINKIT